MKKEESQQSGSHLLKWIKSNFPAWPSAPGWYDEGLKTDISPDMRSYVNNRLKPFTSDLYIKANSHMSHYYRLQLIIITFGTLIPIVNVVNFPEARIISTIFASIVVGATGIIQLTKLRESGIVFRIITARLQREYHSFMQKVDAYQSEKQGGDREKLFIHNVESLISNATSEYYDLFRDTRQEGTQTTGSGSITHSEQEQSTGQNNSYR